jgi:transcriptional repressor NrdR
MICPHCGSVRVKVLETREHSLDNSVRRRRECAHCKRRFTSYEVIETPPLRVVKRSGWQEVFQLAKVQTSVDIALRKRNVNPKDVSDMVKHIHEDIKESANDHGLVNATQVGDIILERLRVVDTTAYIRFASVYYSFNDVNGFIEFINSIKEN